ncbi:MAG: rhodanese-related sulfurtransferase [Snowella sp.]|nr:rhodanese-related sulfurtransferase [Snowella sp.]
MSTFYKFVRLTNLEEKRSRWLAYCQDKSIKGTILLASEGINGTLAGFPDAIADFFALLRAESGLNDLSTKDTWAETFPFERMKIKLKPEIVTLGQAGVDPTQQVGIYVAPQDWNRLIQDPEVLVLDTRNNYEVRVGTFQGAINPQTQSFREFPDYVEQNLNPQDHPKIAMFCTGGIRCEKASSFLLNRGFQEVYHLKGGILNYLAEIPSTESLWQGECFVFDQRVAVQHGLEEGTYDLCPACGSPISESDKLSYTDQAGVSCPYCFSSLTPETKIKQEKQPQLGKIEANEFVSTIN